MSGEGNGTAACKGCGEKISEREDQLNDGLCFGCFAVIQAAVTRRMAEELAP